MSLRLVIILSFLAFSCTGALPDKDELINQFYIEKLMSLHNEADASCRIRAIENAELFVDSLVDQWINADLLDTVLFPAKPLKPQAPDPIIGTVEPFELDSLK